MFISKVMEILKWIPVVRPAYIAQSTKHTASAVQTGACIGCVRKSASLVIFFRESASGSPGGGSVRCNKISYLTVNVFPMFRTYDAVVCGLIFRKYVSGEIVNSVATSTPPGDPGSRHGRKVEEKR